MTIPAKICFFVSISSALMGFIAFSIGFLNLYVPGADSSDAVSNHKFYPLMLGAVCFQLAATAGAFAQSM